MLKILNRCESHIVGGVVAALLCATDGAALDAPTPVVERAVRLFSGQRLSTWSFVGGLGVADVDGDGLNDAAVGTHNGILLLRGDESGAFSTERRIGDDRFDDVRLADFDNDGFLDLLAYRSFPFELEAYFGKGGFDFNDPRVVSPTSSYLATIADFTSDGLPDVLLQDGILIARTDRTFDEREIDFAGSVAWVGDLDSDSVLDVVTNDGDLYTFFGLGDGRFTRGPLFEFNGDVWLPVSFADLNGDGRLELLVITVHGELRVHSPSQPLDFDLDSFTAYPTRPEGFPVYSSPAQILVADFDRDSLLDVGVTNYARSDLSILFGKAEGGFEQSILYGTSVQPGALVLTRLGHGSASIGALVQAEGGPVVISSRELRDRNPQRVLFNADGPFDPSSIALGDIDGDGNLDIATIGGKDYDDGSIIVFFGTDVPGVAVPVTLAGGVSPRLLRVADLTGDGFDDIVVGREERPHLSVLRGGPDRNSVGATVWSGDSIGPTTRTNELHLADLNGDSHLDLVVAGLYRFWLETLLGQGDGSFVEGADFEESHGAVAIADFDTDGALDFAIGKTDGSVFVRLGDGAGGAGAPVEFDTGYMGIRDLAAADANGDGRMDVVYSAQVSLESDSIGTLLNLDGCFGDCNQDSRVTISELTVGVRMLLELDTVACEALDVDGDDLVVIADLVRAVRSALYGCSASLFKTPGLSTLVDNTIFATKIRVADIDRDDIVDVVGIQDGGVGLAFGRGDGSFESPVWFGKGNGDLALELADYNEDGRLDIVTTNSSPFRGSGRRVYDQAVLIMLQKPD